MSCEWVTKELQTSCNSVTKELRMSHEPVAKELQDLGAARPSAGWAPRSLAGGGAQTLLKLFRNNRKVNIYSYIYIYRERDKTKRRYIYIYIYTRSYISIFHLLIY